MRYHTAVPLGEGGMGEVFEAWDPDLERTVVLKVLRRGHPDASARILAEARAQARVEHPNVCKVFEVGETAEGRPFVAMQRIEGRPLDEAAAGLGTERAVRLVATVAGAVQAAHEAGLVHRDLKPGNILVEERPDGELVPFVVDFGIAREVEAEGLTRTGFAVGTPGYMSPEQARGDRRIDRRTDVFSLGVVLYELLAGRLPFPGESSFEVLAAVLRDDPAPLRRVAPHVPLDLETVVMKAVDPDPDRRYASIRAFAEDLGRFLAGEPISARAVGPAERLLRWARRNRATAAAVALGVVSVVGLGSWALRERWRGELRELRAGRVASGLEEIDASLRFAHLAPLHDVRPARAAAEQRARALLDDLSEQASEGLAAWARGRLALAFGDDRAARRELERAWAAGHRSPEIRTALGLALALGYEREAESARRTRDPEARQVALGELEAELRDPALEHLREAAADRPAEAALIRARIALLEERGDDAIAAAREALAVEPWLHEAWLVIARVHSLRCADLEARGELEAARATLADAETALAEAVAIGRSDPAVHEQRCAWWSRLLDLDRGIGRDLSFAYAGLQRACDEALAVDRDSGEAWNQLARAHWRWAERLQRRGEDPLPTVDVSIEAAGRAADLLPGDRRPANLLGLAWWRRALYEERHGRDPREAVARALEAFDRSSAIDPSYRHPPNNRANALLIRARWEASDGLDPEPTLRAAATSYEEAIRLDPEYPLPHSNLSLVSSWLGRLAAIRSEDPRPDFATARRHLERALELNPRYWNAWNHLLSLELQEARWWVFRDLAAAQRHLEWAEKAAERAVEVNDTVTEVWSNRAAGARLAALVDWLAGRDPEGSWARSDAAADRALGLDATFPETHEHAAGVAVDRAVRAVRDGRSDEAVTAVRRARRETIGACRALGEDHPVCTKVSIRAALLEALVGDREGATAELGRLSASLRDREGESAALTVEAWAAAVLAVGSVGGEADEAWRRCAEAAGRARERAPDSAEALALGARCRFGSQPADPGGEARTELSAALSLAPLLSWWPMLDPRGLDPSAAG